MEKKQKTYGSSQKLIDMSAFGHMGFGIICPLLISNKNAKNYMINFFFFLVFHTIIEMFENSHVGVMFWKCNGHGYYYGDSPINVIGDTLGFIVGWIIGYFISINLTIPNYYKNVFIVIVTVCLLFYFFGNMSDSSRGMYKFLQYLYKCKFKKNCSVKDCKHYSTPAETLRKIVKKII